jgi:Tfp pilus assembly protein FimT
LLHSSTDQPTSNASFSRKIQSSPYSYQTGISLLELIAAVCIIGIISSIGYVSLSPLWRKQVLNSAVSEMENTIQFLRMKAIIENATIEMKLEAASLRYRKREGKNWGDWNIHGLDKSVVHIVNGSLYFSGAGFSSPKTILLKHEPFSRKLIININGRIRKSDSF